MLDWHLDYYRRHPRQFRNRRCQTAQGFVLTTAEKRRILLNNIYGVDLDQNAVEVSKLALLLKMLENESEAEGRQTLMFSAGGRILPDLSRNVKWGNSLIGSDFYRGKQLDMFDDEAMYRVKAFDWDSEAHGFGEIMKRGGFDAVIGNPPYVRQEILGKPFKDYAKRKYETYAGTADLYTYFIEKGVKLLNENGLFGIIVANKWMRAKYGKPLRIWLKQRDIREIIDFGDLQVFQDATTYPCIITISSQDSASGVFLATTVENLTFESLANYVKETRFSVNQTNLNDNGWSLVSESDSRIIAKISTQGIELAQYGSEVGIYRGVTTGLNKAFVIDEETKNKLIKDNSANSLLVKPLLRGRDIKRYENPIPNEYLILIPSGWTDSQRGSQDAWTYLSEHHHAIADYLSPFERDARKRANQGQYWWEMNPINFYEAFEKPKLMLPDISLRGNFILDATGKYCINTAYIIGSDDKYLLGILNSKLITFFYENVSSKYRGGYLRFTYQYLAGIPIRAIDFDDPADVAMHAEMVALVETMLDLHKQLPGLSGIQREMVAAQIERADAEIDGLVYRLYGLTDDEIAVVEG